MWSFDEDSHDGTVVLDDGSRLAFDRRVFAASALRLLRSGQRVRLTLDGDVVTALTIITLSDPA